MRNKKLALLAAFIVAGLASYSAFGQAELNWFNTVDAQWESPADADPGTEGIVPYFGADPSIIPGVPDDSTVGALIQIIHDVNADGPSGITNNTFGAGTGVQGDDVVLGATWAGKGAIGIGGIWSDQQSLASLGIPDTAQVFMRIFDRPSPTGVGNPAAGAAHTIPGLLDYPDGGQAEINYPAMAGMQGFFYHDTTPVVVNTLPSGGGIFQYSASSISFDGSTDWSVYAEPIPEPGTFVLAGLGLLALFIRRFRK